MIYVIIGPSCAGKSTFTKNSFLNGDFKTYKDLVAITETDSAYLIGKYYQEGDDINRVRRLGTDSISRSEIVNILPQILSLQGKDVVVEGEKITSHPFMDGLISSGKQFKLIYIYCDLDESIRRNRANGSAFKDSYLKCLWSKSRNLALDYYDKVDEVQIDTTNYREEDFATLSLDSIPSESDSSSMYNRLW